MPHSLFEKGDTSCVRQELKKPEPLTNVRIFKNSYRFSKTNTPNLDKYQFR